jgi:hypothetical protein
LELARHKKSESYFFVYIMVGMATVASPDQYAVMLQCSTGVILPDRLLDTF